MPLSGSGPPLFAGILAGLVLSWWGRPSPSPPAPVLAQQVGPQPLACPASLGWAPWAVGAAFLGGVLVAGCLVLCGACAVFGAGFLWSRFAGPAPLRRTAVDRLALH